MIIKLIVKTSSRRLKPVFCQTQQHKTVRLTPYSILPPNADSVICHCRYQNSLVCISCYHNRHRQNLIPIFYALDKPRTRQAYFPYVFIRLPSVGLHWWLAYVYCYKSCHRHNLISVLRRTTGQLYSQAWRILAVILGAGRLLLSLTVLKLVEGISRST
jgi:hypothetical protein